MKSLKTSAQEINSRTKYLQPGIHQKLSLESVELHDNYIDFNIVSEAEEKYRDRVFFPNPESEWIKQNPENLSKEEDTFLDKLSQYVLLYVEADKIPDTSGMSYKDVAALCKNIITQNMGTQVKFNMKLVPDSQGLYARSPKFAPYVEKYEEGKPTTLKYSKWELDNLINKPKVSEDDVTLPEPQGDDSPLF